MHEYGALGHNRRSLDWTQRLTPGSQLCLLLINAAARLSCASTLHAASCTHHELKHKCQAPCGLVVQHLQQLDDVGVRGQPPQRLDLTQVVDLGFWG